MKRLVLRIGVPAISVVLGFIAFAYAQRGGDISPLRGDAQSTSSPSSINPLRDNALRVGPPADKSIEKKAISDTRIRKVAADAKTDNPVFADATTGTVPVNPEAKSLSGDNIPDASALDSPPTSGNADQMRYPQLVGHTRNNPPMVERYSSNKKAIDRRGNKSTDAKNSSSTLSNEPAPFKTDPFSSPTAISQSSDRTRERGAKPTTENSVERSSNDEGVGQPGPKQIEGIQSPQVTIQKFVPNEIQVGKPAIFKITVRNTGSIAAGQVEIRDQVPKGTKLLGTTPQSSPGGRGELVWTIGTMRPGEESSVEMELMPTAEGEIGSVATVHFSGNASAKTISTRPQLALEIAAPNNVLIGEPVSLAITISNPGTGIATGVVLEERIPQGLRLAAEKSSEEPGNELEYEVGDLRPGESKKLELPLAAVAPGKIVNVLTARADGNLRAQEQLEFQIIAPKLDIALEGPKRRFLEREAVYQVSLSNPGTAAAKDVELVAYLPAGLKFLSANNAGHYDETDRAVHWRLEELPCNETGSVELVTMPVAAGQHSLKLRGTAERGVAVDAEQPVLVEGIAAIAFQAVDVTGPVEVGGETTYEVNVINQGTKAASNVRLAVLLPPEMQPLTAEGPTRHAIEGNRVVFEGLARLAPKADTNYRVKVKGIRPGDLRTRFQLVTDEMKSPLTKEESTRVFADE